MKRILSLMLLLSALTGAAQTLKVEGPGVVSLDETFRIVFTADERMSDFQWPGTDDFDVVWGPQKGSMSSTSIVNGKRTSTHQETVTYLLQPKQTGTFTLPAATATVGKESVSSSTVKVEVVAGQPQAQQQGQSQAQGQGQSQAQGNSGSGGNDDPAVTGTVSNQDIFLRLTLNKSQVVKGEPVTATLKIYTRADITAFEDIKFPTFNGFWSKETVTVNNLDFNRENVGGTIYNAALLRQWVLIPQQTGKLTIDPAEMVCQVRVRTASGGSPLSIFDDFFDQYQTIRKRISTPALQVTVRDLPAGAPASFSGGVGDFKITAKLSRENLKSNEAGSLLVTLSGNGNLSMLEAPKVNFPPDFEVYDLKSTDKTSASGTSGSKTFEFPFIPRSHGEFVIPSIEYTYYDNAHGKYVTTSTGDIPVSVEKGEEIAGGGVAVAGVNRQGVRNLGEDIRYIALGDGNLRKKGAFFAGSPLFFILLAMLTLAFFLISLFLRRRQARRADIAALKNRRANKMARTRLKAAEEYLRQNLSGAYYEELHKALLGYVSDKLMIPAADLSKETICGTLLERGVSEKDVTALDALLDRCEEARYAPESAQTRMENEYNDALKVISDIEGQLKGGKPAGKPTAAPLAVLLLALGLAAAAPASAQDDVAGLWQQAGEAFAAGQWQNALNLYQMIEGENLQSADLYYNMGNAYFKLEDPAHAILCYERALKLDPAHADAANNLEVVSQTTLDRIDAVPEFILVSGFRKLRESFPADTWAWITLALALMVGVLMLLFLHGGSGPLRKTSFIVACVVFVLAVFAFIFSLQQRRAATRQDSAVVTAPVCSVKSSPADAGNTVFVLHEGTKIRLLDDVGDWAKIEIADGRQGWAKTNLYEVI